jgi:hypothetical protein
MQFCVKDFLTPQLSVNIKQIKIHSSFTYYIINQLNGKDLNTKLLFYGSYITGILEGMWATAAGDCLSGLCEKKYWSEKDFKLRYGIIGDDTENIIWHMFWIYLHDII